MEFKIILLFAAIYCAASRFVPVNHTAIHATIEEENRYIYLPDGNGSPVFVDLLETIKTEEKLKVNNSDVRYYIFTRRNPFRPIEILNGRISQLPKSAFDPKKPILFAVHGWVASNTSDFCGKMRQSLERHDINLILVDWSNVAFKSYMIASFSVSKVGRIVGNFISSLQTKLKIPGSQIRIVGHSLGAHIAGIAGATVIKIHEKSVDHIVGLDPAEPLFDINDPENCLDRSDADFVQVIHTSIRILGIPQPIGHSNYYPNGGMDQPGCGMDPIEEVVGGCSHCRSYKYYTESLIRGEVFIGKKCGSYEDYKAGKCDGNEQSPMGLFDIDKKASGVYYLETNWKSPYGERAKQKN